MSDEESDFKLASDLQKEFNKEFENSSDDSDIKEVNFVPSTKKRGNYRSNLDPDFLDRTQNLVHPQWETLDPTPDIFTLFKAFDGKFFQSRLQCVTLEWSKRMYSCAGICYSRRNRFGMDVTIRLSEPLLKLRPRKDLVETMLHEMIHAYCFVLNIREGNGGHGPNFKKIMLAINKVAGTNITIYHTFYDEVANYKQHWWRCNGSCTQRAPFFGYVKRTTNRAPGYYDQWWQAHLESCGGTFLKIKEPEQNKKQKSKQEKDKENKAQSNTNNIRKYFSTNSDNKKKNITDNTNFSNSSNSTNTKEFININVDGGYKGTKNNGDGTMVLNPKSTMKSIQSSSSSSIATLFPPTSYPGFSSNPLNKGGIKSFRDININDQTNSRIISTPKKIVMSGKGYTLDTNSTKKSPTSNNGQVDREHLRKIWAKRFDEGNQNKSTDTKTPINEQSIKIEKRHSDTIDDNDNDNDGIVNNSKPEAAKRRRISENANKNPHWIILDDEIMVKEQENEVITISGDSESDSEPSTSQKINKKLTGEERLNAIKQEIIDESMDLIKDDIILIDDEYNDDSNSNALIAAGELADTSVIDEFFGEDTLLREFKNENDVVPTFSRHIPNPDDDIITCPICQGKMKRCVFGEHLDGCTGIAIRVKLSTAVLQKITTKSRNSTKPQNTKRPSHKKAKNILRDAGYTEEDLKKIGELSSTDDDDSFTSAPPEINNSVTNLNVNSSSSSLPALDQNSKRYRQRNLYKTTNQCPACGIEVEEDEMNEHLDECVENSYK